MLILNLLSGRDRMVVGFTTTRPVSIHITAKVVSSAGRWFSPGIPISSTNKTIRHDTISPKSIKIGLLIVIHIVYVEKIYSPLQS